MFRRSGKNHDEANPLFIDEPTFNKYPAKKPEPMDGAQRLFETSAPRPMPMETQEEGWQNMKTAHLPHHFEGMLTEEAPETTLGAGVTFRGSLSFERFLRIDGSFEGELLSQGKVVVGPTGRIKADLNLREAIIEGIVEGNITVLEKLELRGQALIVGDIQAASLCVDEGVCINGHVKIGKPLEQIEAGS